MAENGQPPIPVVDLSNYFSSAPEQRQRVSKDLADVCCRVGFVYLVGHGLSPELQRQAFSWSKKLFDLSHEDKMKAPHPPGPTVHRGYSHPGLEKVSQEVGSDDEQGSRAKALRQVQDYKESYEVGSEDFADQPNVWLPEDVLPGFRAFMTDFYWEFNKTARLVLEAVAEGLSLTEDDTKTLLRVHTGLNNQLRLLHYPPVSAEAVENQTTNISPDSSFTMLLQDDCGGLQVEKPDEEGSFIPVHPIPGAIVLNIGDLLQRWSNDILKSTLHRVTLPPLQDRFTGADRLTRARYSIPYFVAPDPSAVIECLEACANEARPVRYGPVRQRDYGAMRAGMHYEGKVEGDEGKGGVAVKG
ncbi:MAG: hypothetical protein M1817_005060 [Caeruleum heppii]|nr:MAG: hypothetical protein M1817_005060 [Caeruleum heppii]